MALGIANSSNPRGKSSLCGKRLKLRRRGSGIVALARFLPATIAFPALLAVGVLLGPASPAFVIAVAAAGLLVYGRLK